MEEEKMVNDDYYDEGKETSIISCSTSAGDFKMKLHKVRTKDDPPLFASSILLLYYNKYII